MLPDRADPHPKIAPRTGNVAATIGVNSHEGSTPRVQNTRARVSSQCIDVVVVDSVPAKACSGSGFDSLGQARGMPNDTEHVVDRRIRG